MTMGRMLDVRINLQDKTVSLKGRDETSIIRQDTWDIADYLKTARSYEKKIERIEREKAKYAIEGSYDYERLDQLIMQTSRTVNNRVVARGLKNRDKTVSKVLTRDKETGMNKIREAAMNLEQLRKLKYESIENPDKWIEAAGYNVSDFKKTVGKGDKQRQVFKSKKLEKEYIRLLSKVVVDEDYTDSPGEFSGFFSDVFENFVDETTTTKKFWGSLNETDRLKLMQEYVTKLETKMFNPMVDENEEDFEEVYTTLSKKFNKKKGRKK